MDETVWLVALKDKLAPAVVWAAGMVSESLGKRLLDWINPMHETQSWRETTLQKTLHEFQTRSNWRSLTSCIDFLIDRSLAWYRDSIAALEASTTNATVQSFLANTFVSEASTNVKYVQRGLSKILNIKAIFCNLAFVAWPYEESCSTSESRRRLARDWGWTWKGGERTSRATSRRFTK